MYMAKKIRIQHMLHIHEHLFQNNIESFDRKIDPKVYLTYTYLSGLSLPSVNITRNNKFVCNEDTHRSKEKMIQEEKIYLT